MKRISTKRKWTKGRSTIDRQVKRAKAPLALRQKTIYKSAEFVKSLFTAK